MGSDYGSVLLVERDQAAKQDLERALLREGLQTLWARTQAEAESLMASRQPCLIILNPRLPPEDGWLVYRQLRRHQVPIMLMTPRSDPAIQRVALAMGADDCVANGAGPEDVATRARFVLRRMSKEAEKPISYGDITLDPSQGGARVAGRIIHLTRSEYALLAALIEAQGRVVPREQLVVRARAYAGALPLARSIDAHVRTLRRKLDDDPHRPSMVLSVRGFGYRLAAPNSVAVDGLAQAAFAALPEPTLVLDGKGRVRLVNDALVRLVGRSSQSIVDQMTCADLLRCDSSKLGAGACLGLQALNSGETHSMRQQICPKEETLGMHETITPLPGDPHYLLLQIRESSHD